MALSQDEKDILLELKDKGYSFSEAMGFIGSNRVGQPSTVSRDLVGQSEGEVSRATPRENGVIADLKSGFTGAQTALEQGLERTDAASKRSSLFGRTSGRLAAGFRFAGDALASIGEGAVRALPGGTTAMDFVNEKVGQGAQKVGQSQFGQNIGSFYDSLPPEVKTVAQDLGNIVSGGTGIAGALAVPAAATSATKIVRTGIKNIDDAAQEVANAGITKVGREGIEQSFDLGVNAENLMQRVARISKGKQTKFEERAGQSVGKYLIERDIFGTPDQIADQLVDRVRTYKNRVDRNLADIDGSYKAPQIKTALDDLNEINAKVSTLGAVGRDSTRITELTKKHQTTGLSLSEVNEVKRLYERNVRLNYLNPASPKPEKLTRANNIDSALRSFVERKAGEKGFTNIKALNKETTLAKQLADDLGAEFAGKQGNNMITLTDWILLAEAANSPTAAAGFIGKKLFGSEYVMSATARAIAKNKGIKQNVVPLRTDPKVNGYLEFLKKQGLVDEPQDFNPGATPQTTGAAAIRNPITDTDLKNKVTAAGQNYDELVTKVDAKLALADEAKKYIDSEVQKIVDSIDGTVLAAAPVKSQARIIEKAAMEEAGNVDNIRDIARNTVIPMSPKAQQTAIAQLSQRTDLARPPKIQTPDKFMGYEGFIVNVTAPNGLVSEIQVVTPQMTFGKNLPEFSKSVLGEELFNKLKASGLEPGLGHKFYEMVRELDKNAPDYLDKLKAIEAESIDYYEKLRSIGL